MSKLDNAIAYATKMHHGQTRSNDGKPYITHLLRVMEILRGYDLPEEILIAAVLHDIYEDTDGNFVDIRNEYGDRVAYIVEGLSKNQKPAYPDKIQNPINDDTVLNVEFYEKLTKLEEVNVRFSLYINRFYYSVIADPWIALVKIADQLDNLSDVECLPPEKALRKLNEIDHYFLPVYQKILDQKIFSHMYEPTYTSLKGRLEKLVEEKQKIVDTNATISNHSTQ